MVDRLPLGPYRTLQTGEGVSVPYYIVPFDEEGRCSGPRTRAELVARVGAGSFSDIFVFSHGWNNGWKQATERYEHFITGYMRQRQEFGLPVPGGFRPLLVGIFWPSKLLVGAEDRAPAIAAASPETVDELVAEERAEVAELATAVPAEHVERFYALAQSDSLTKDEALELARMVAGLYAADVEEAGDEAAPTVEEIVGSWKGPPRRRGDPGDLDDFGTADAAAPSADSPDAAARIVAPQTAGVVDFLSGRSIVRTLSVWQMKDRAGRVGAKGVGPLLVDILQADQQVRVHAIGHSFGAKVMLSATCAPARLPRPIESALLLQPAISHLCFAAAVPGTGRPGGYRGALDRVRKPILATFSRKDRELRNFHLGLRRDEDLGEAKIAADEPPSRYAALGGYGPRGLGAGGRLEPVKDAVDRYNLATDGVEVYGIDSSRTIANHGDISNPSTWWMLYNLVTS
ncbi:MAG: hypothetical protein ACRDYA_17585 [Egibacteraceae bacterium]